MTDRTNKPIGGKRAGASLFTILAVVLALVAKQQGWIGGKSSTAPPPPSGTPTQAKNSPRGSDGAAAIEAAFRDHQSDLWVEASGEVVKVLPDDRDGEQHQKMLVRVRGASNLTVLIAHSLSAASRVPAREGDQIRFRGEYKWTEQGGTIHFTHTPQFKRAEPGGWIEHDGKRYE